MLSTKSTDDNSRGDDHHGRPRHQESSPLLHHTIPLPAYHDDLPSMEALGDGGRAVPAQPANGRRARRLQRAARLKKKRQSAPSPPPKPPPINSCGVYIGRVLVALERYKISSNLKKLFNVVLINAAIVCFLLILSRALNNELFHSSFFRSDSPPLLLAANVIMMGSYSIENFLMLRIFLSVGCGCFALWGLTSEPMLFDATMFNAVMLLLNLRHAVLLSYRHRHIDFLPQWEQIYCAVFEGYLNRDDFAKLAAISYVRRTKKGEVFKAKGDEITSLCVLVRGRMSVLREADPELEADAGPEVEPRGDAAEQDSESEIERFLRNPQFVNLIEKNNFVEAPQWTTANLRPEGDRFTVSFVAVDDVEFIKWPRENLIDLIARNSNIYHALSGVLGLHTARALLQSREYNKIQAELSIAGREEEEQRATP